MSKYIVLTSTAFSILFLVLSYVIFYSSSLMRDNVIFIVNFYALEESLTFKDFFPLTVAPNSSTLCCFQNTFLPLPGLGK